MAKRQKKEKSTKASKEEAKKAKGGMTPPLTDSSSGGHGSIGGRVY